MSKTRGPSKAQLILNEARERLQAAKDRFDKAHQETEIARAVYEAEDRSFDALERSLARAPRGKQSGAPSAGKKSSQKGAETKSTANTQTSLEDVGIAASGD